MVFFTPRVNQKLLDAMLGFAGGVMIAASYWSLLAPAIEISRGRPGPVWLPALVGFMAGGLTMMGVDKILPHLHPDLSIRQAEGPHTTWRRSILLFSAMTLHNIPEGLAVGVAFGGIVSGQPEASLGAAIALSIGIGLQNFPEGIAVSMPLRGHGVSKLKCFWFGQLSATVEPVAAVIGAATAIYVIAVLPYALAFAAGAMVFVVIEEVGPASQRAGRIDWATIWFMIGFSVMMVLDVALG